MAPVTPTITAPVLRAVGGKVLANSRDVAEAFEKQHAHVLRDIDALIGEAPTTASNFGASSYKDSTGRTLRAFDMDRDGFSLLAMGFTGSKALRFKLAYIASRASGAEFNRMEGELRAAGIWYGLRNNVAGHAASSLLRWIRIQKYPPRGRSCPRTVA